MAAAEYVDDPPGSQDERCRADSLCLAFVANEEVVEGHAQWRNPGLECRVDSTQSSVAKGPDAPISACVANECNRVLGQELTGEVEKLDADLVRGATKKQVSA